MSWLRDALESLPGPHLDAGAAVEARARQVLRPLGALARLDEVARWVAEWQGSSAPLVRRPAALIFAADHGVAAAGVSNYPSSVTADMLAAYRTGRATVNAFARIAGVAVRAVDVGVGTPTADMRTEPALSPARFEAAVRAGGRAVEELETDLLVLGEMGIGNTTAASAVLAALSGDDAAVWVGRGTGVDDDGLARKVAAVRAATARIRGIDDPLEVLREVGGAELAAIAGAVVAARLRRIPVLLDGFVVTAAVAPLAALRPDALQHCCAAHCSAEAGHRRLLSWLGLTPLLDLGMRLGEGSGAMAAVPLVAMACAGVTEVPTFEEWFG